MTEYAVKVANQVYEKFKILGEAGADMGLVYSEFSRNAEVFHHYFSETKTSNIVVKKNYDAPALKKVIFAIFGITV